MTPSRDTRRPCRRFSLQNITTVALNSRTAELISTKPSVVTRIIPENVLGRKDVGPSQKEAKESPCSRTDGKFDLTHETYYVSEMKISIGSRTWRGEGKRQEDDDSPVFPRLLCE